MSVPSLVPTLAIPAAQVVSAAPSPLPAQADPGIFLISGVPFWVILVFAFAIVFCRAQGTYWLGRGLRVGTVRSRWARYVETDGAQRALRTLNRWGLPAVTISFLTIGIQTVINLMAGYTRMPFVRYLVAMVPGCAAWAIIWTTIGAAAFNTALLVAARSPIGLAVLAAAVTGVGAWVIVRRRRRRAVSPELAATSARPAGPGQ